jgi:cation diffusion facilitator CzcD-associated flavoprotein CzcO
MVTVSRNSGSILHAAIVGAGPYGLSLSAHLREAGVPHRIFGRPMKSWATQMPAGMKLKSDGFASNLSAGSIPFTLEDFARLTGRPYHATQLPVAIEDFIAYGQEFARRFVPGLEEMDVTSIEREGRAFRVTLENGETFLTRHVVLATGVGP